MIGRSAIAGKTSFCTNLIILLFHLISMHTLKKKKKNNIQSKRRGKEMERLF